MLKVTPKELEQYSLSDLWYASIGASIDKRSDWEIGRFVSLYSAGPHSKKINKVQDICMFPWEENTGQKGSKSNPWTPKELKELIKSGKHPLVDKDGKRRN